LEFDEVPLVLEPVVECVIDPSMTALSSADIVFQMSLASSDSFSHWVLEEDVIQEHFD
jgi:hypothetical protein